MGHAIPLETRIKIAEDLAGGRTVAETAARNGVGTATVKRISWRVRDTGSPAAKRKGPKPGRRALTAESVAFICARVRAEPTLRIYDLVRELAERGAKASEGTVRRALHESGISKQRLARERREATPTEKPRFRYSAAHRPKAPVHAHRKGYPSDVTDAEWEVLRPLLPIKGRGVPRKVGMRDVLDAIRYQQRTGCAWRYLPNDLPNWQSVLRCFTEWTRGGVWDRLHDALRERLRVASSKNATPTAGILDSQTVKASGQGGPAGYDGGKKINGRKRHIVVDTLGLLMAVAVHSAGIHDRDGARQVVNAELVRTYPTLQTVFADAGYQGRCERQIREELPALKFDIVRRRGDATNGEWAATDGPPPARPQGFQLVRKRWIVERTFSWLYRYRRLVRDYEASASSSRARVVVAMVQTMLARLLVVDPS